MHAIEKVTLNYVQCSWQLGIHLLVSACSVFRVDFNVLMMYPGE